MSSNKDPEGRVKRRRENDKKKNCFEFQRTGSCNWGDKCRFAHGE